MQQDMYASLGHPTSPDSDITTRYNRWLNQAHREILQKKHFRRFKRRALTMATIASSPYIAIPQATSRIFSVRNTAQDREIVFRDMAWVRRMDPGLNNTTSDPEVYAVYSYSSPVMRQPSAASAIWVDADGATTETVHLQGVLSTGYQKSVSTAMTGTTAKAIAADTFIAINKFFLAVAVAASDVFITEGSAGAELARIPMGRTYSRYTLLYLWPTPTSVITLNIDAEVNVEDLAIAGDEPLIPIEFHEMLIAKVKSKEYERREKLTLKRESDARYQVLLNDFYTYVSQMESPSGQESRGFSQLGPFYESGT
jgi:hypothetical protein